MVDEIQRVSWCPFIVSLKRYSEDRFGLCGGTVLTHTLTLTAAHCLFNGTNGLYLLFGSLKLFAGLEYKATRIFVHSMFDPATLTHDIGLASIFPAFVRYSKHIRPTPLPHPCDVLKPGDEVTIYGWGAISETEKYSKYLLSATLPVVDKDKCRTLIHGTLPTNSFCLGYEDGHLDACSGDSGGPAIARGVQVGITSFGEGCALPLKPGVYTDLTKYLDWLHAARRILL